MIGFPSQVLLDFFNEASDSLSQAHLVKSSHYDLPPGEENDKIVMDLNQHRQLLLRIQVSILEKVVSDYNNENEKGGDIAIEQAQQALKELGAKGSEEGAEEEEKELMEAMTNMNTMARIAFTRLVLQSEWKWFEENSEYNEDFQNKDNTGEATMAMSSISLPTRDGLKDGSDGESMTTSDINDFCALCTTAVNLPEVQRYIGYGERLYVGKDVNIDENLTPPSESSIKSGLEASLLINERIMNLQNLFYRAVGYEPAFAISEIGNLLSKNPSTDEEIDVFEKLNSFVSSMKVALQNAAAPTELLSDENEGGCTRVLSVNYSEFEFDPSAPTGPTPDSNSLSINRMQEHDEEEQRRQLHMAQQAASLQQGILGELLSMEEEEREETLALAKETHDSFLKRAMQLPIGPERVQYLQTMDSDEQRLMVMHKLWEKLLAENGGEPPRIRRDENH